MDELFEPYENTEPLAQFSTSCVEGKGNILLHFATPFLEISMIALCNCY
jgi:hypothetical protein